MPKFKSGPKRRHFVVFKGRFDQYQWIFKERAGRESLSHIKAPDTLTVSIFSLISLWKAVQFAVCNRPTSVSYLTKLMTLISFSFVFSANQQIIACYCNTLLNISTVIVIILARWLKFPCPPRTCRCCRVRKILWIPLFIKLWNTSLPLIVYRDGQRERRPKNEAKTSSLPPGGGLHYRT